MEIATIEQLSDFVTSLRNAVRLVTTDVGSEAEALQGAIIKACDQFEDRWLKQRGDPGKVEAPDGG